MGVLVKKALGIAFLGGSLVSVAVAQQKPVATDAKVESDVLKALANAPELATQNIQTTTVYGVVTLTGSASDEASRSKAENLVARVAGVKKVVDEMTLDTETREQRTNSEQQTVLQSDGSYAPVLAQGPAPGQVEAQSRNEQAEPGYTSPPAPTSGAPVTAQASGSYSQQPPQAPQREEQYPPQRRPQGDERYPAQANGQYPPRPPSGPYPPRRPLYSGDSSYRPQAAYPVQGGQEAGRQVTIASGALVRIRINQGLSGNHSQPGSLFEATVLNDVVADGAVAIPRGASVQGTVVDAKSAGVLKGRGELALQLTRLTLGGQTYPLFSDVWTRTGADKTVRTVDSALGLGALGAVFGAVAGGGAGAAIGAGVGGAAGVATSAASQGGSVIVPPEAVLTFHLQQPTTVATVSEQEMGRLAYAAGPNSAGPALVQRRRYPGVYYNPYRTMGRTGRTTVPVTSLKARG